MTSTYMETSTNKMRSLGTIKAKSLKFLRQKIVLCQPQRALTLRLLEDQWNIDIRLQGVQMV